jgi:hypothetical protein
MDSKNLSYKIHVFGDSHSRLYASKNLKDYSCEIYYSGDTVRMERIANEKLSIDDIIIVVDKFLPNYLNDAKKEYKHITIPSKEIKEGDLIIFVYGEPYIRTLYVQELDKGKEKNEFLNDLVNKYVECILMNKHNYPGVKFALQSVTPPVDEKNYQEGINKDWPPVGTIEQRIEGNFLINSIMKKKCLENDIIYIDTATYYQNDNSSFPLDGIDTKSQLYELDTRIKDSGTHVYIDNSECLDLALKDSNIPSNINFSKPNYESYINIKSSDIVVFFDEYILFVILLFILFFCFLYKTNLIQYIKKNNIFKSFVK